MVGFRWVKDAGDGGDVLGNKQRSLWDICIDMGRERV